MPEGKLIGAFRSNSAAYQADILNYYDHENEHEKKAFSIFGGQAVAGGESRGVPN